ncbi:MAG: methylisocitrate lyase [Candidatus Hydrogenedens sp.]|nr:methylisocitrate lyase [Candidatus Hydrogenedens sp.]
MPGAINALSAKLIESMGFEALYLSGAVLANSVHGFPDVGMTTLSEAERHAQAVSNACSLPIVMDADTGFGERENTARTVQVLEHAGVSAIHLEDQEFPKRCGHLEGKRLVPAEAFAEKIAAAAEARRSKDFLIIARTDARGVEGYDEAVRRARLYLDAGAEAVFPEALTSEEELRRFAQDVDTLLLANMTEFGKTPFYSVEEFAGMGYNMVIFPVTLQRAAMKAMEQVLTEIREHGTQRESAARMQTRQELYDLLGYDGKVN